MKRYEVLILLALLFVIYQADAVAQIGSHALMRFYPHTFADLQMADMPDMKPALPDGAITYCTDCKVPTAQGEKCSAGPAGSKGAEAHRIRGQWNCY